MQRSNLRSGNPNASLNINRQGGRPGVRSFYFKRHSAGRLTVPQTMVLGMATVAAGLGAFWVFQFRQQNRSHSSSDPGEMPTCESHLIRYAQPLTRHHAGQFRHAQQVSEVNDRMAGTSRGKATPLRPAGQQPIQYKSTAPADSKDAVASNNGSSDTRRQSYTDRGVIGTIMTTLHVRAEGSSSTCSACSRLSGRT